MSTIDFNKPATTDLYTAWPTSIQGNQQSLGFLLDPTYVTSYANLVAGMKRWNAGLVEQWNGSAWAALGTGYALKGGDTFTGAMTFANNIPLQWKDVGGTPRRILDLDPSNNVYIGDVDAATSGGTFVRSAAAINFQISGTTVMGVTSSGVSLAQLASSTSAEAIRLVNNAGYISGFNSANSTRTGYLQFNTGASVILAAENGASLLLSVGGSTRGMFDTNGNFGLGVTPSSWASFFRAIDIQSTGCSLWATGGTDSGIATNAYRSSTAWTYARTAAAAMYDVSSGSHQWNVAVSGTAGTAIAWNQAMMLDMNGNLLIGSTSSVWSSAGRGVVEVNGSSSALFGLKIGGTAAGYIFHSGGTLDLNNQIATANTTISVNGAARLTVGTNGITTFSGGAVTTTNAIGNTGGAVTVDCSKSNVHTLTLTSNMTGLTLSNLQDGQTVNIQITQDGTGSRTMAGLTSANSYLWPGGTIGALSTAASAVDLLVCTKVGTKILTTLAKGFA